MYIRYERLEPAVPHTETDKFKAVAKKKKEKCEIIGALGVGQVVKFVVVRDGKTTVEGIDVLSKMHAGGWKLVKNNLS